jgi:DNA-binding NtrC family response regulator
LAALRCGEANVARNVFVLQAADSNVDLTRLLAAQQWQSRRATRPDEITATLDSWNCYVGIVVFDDALTCSPNELTDVIAASAMEWIAVMPADSARDPVTARALFSSYFDYHTVPVDRSRLLYCIGHAYGKALLRRSALAPPDHPEGRYGMIGKSPRMLALYGELEKIMRARAPVLIIGESGVGKELAALAMHRGSSRRAGPFVPINCGAIPETLIETLLFGHEKGAFTGAHDKHIGSIEAANGGTIFLDEIGDLPLSAQASLLRFLQESTVVRVGSTHAMRIDARIIAATHVDLDAAVRAGRFREDLYYRLNVLQLEVPPLRDRGDDVIFLAQHFFNGHGVGKAPGVRGFADDALKAMQRHPWPGNVRELFNRLQRGMVMCDGPLLTATDLQLQARAGAISLVSLATARNGIERGIVQAALARNRYNVAATARDLSISRVTLYRLLRRLAIRPRRAINGAGALGVLTVQEDM